MYVCVWVRMRACVHNRVHVKLILLQEEEEWEEQPDYLNLQEAQKIQDGEPEDIYVNQESESSSSGELQYECGVDCH